MSSPEIFDKASYHLGGEFPEELDAIHAYVHTGMYLGWLMQANLLAGDATREFEELIEAFLRRDKTGPEIYFAMGGSLTDDLLSNEGIAFTKYYYHPIPAAPYFNDYMIALAGELPTFYHVDDTWENYERLVPFIQRAYEKWQ